MNHPGFRYRISISAACLLVITLTVFSSCRPEKDRTVEQIASLMDRVADWQTENFTYAESGSGGHLHDYGIDAWTNATFYLGLFRWASVSASGERYFEWLYDIGEKNGWVIPANFPETKYGLYHADEICIGQFYLSMYGKYGDEKMYLPVKERIDWIMANPPDPDLSIRSKQSWTWCDALFMAPPVYVMLDKYTEGSNYTVFMDYEFHRTAGYLYDSTEKLFYRDDRYFDMREDNGMKVFWGRGNGWVAAGLANILKLLPEASIYRKYYEELFVELSGRLAALQSDSGFWHASLLDPESYPAPETSATALMAYALAYGIGSGLLPEREYSTVLHKAWKAIETAVGQDGKPGYVQPIGADPKNVTAEMTAVYGSGAILMAGAELVKLLENNSEVRGVFKGTPANP